MRKLSLLFIYPFLLTLLPISTGCSDAFDNLRSESISSNQSDEPLFANSWQGINVFGYLDSVSSDGRFSGWACDPNSPSESLLLHVYSEGKHRITFNTGNHSEDGINQVCRGGNNHRFSYQATAEQIQTLRSGSISVFARNTSNAWEELGGSPKSLQDIGQARDAQQSVVKGYFDGISGSGTMSGWACDIASPNSKLLIHAYIAGKGEFEFSTGITSESAVNTVCGGGGAHRFSFTPSEDKLNILQSGEVRLFVKDTQGSWSQLNGSPAVYQAPPQGKAVVFPHPQGIEKSPDYRLQVNGQEVFVHNDIRLNLNKSPSIYGMKVSYQGFAIFDFEGSVKVDVIMSDALSSRVQNPKIAPLQRNISFTRKGRIISFNLSQPGDYTVDPFGNGETVLHIFTQRPEENPPKKGDPGVIFYGPGVHNIGELNLESNSTLYIAGGAVLRPLSLTPVTGMENVKEPHYGGNSFYNMKAAIRASNVTNLTIKGRGVISGDRGLPAERRFGLLEILGGSNITVQGVTFARSNVWTVHLFNCNNSKIDRVKVLGWFTNSDGLLLHSCVNSSIENSFVHTADDALEIKVNENYPSSGILIKNNQAWADAGAAMGITNEVFNTLDNVVFENNIILRYTAPRNNNNQIPHRGAIMIHTVGDDLISNILFKRNWIDDHQTNSPLVLIKNTKEGNRGGHARMSNIRFEELFTSVGGYAPKIVVFDEGDSNYSNISFKDIYINGGKLPRYPKQLEQRGNPGVIWE